MENARLVTPLAADLFGDLLDPLPSGKLRGRDYWPGLALAGAAALAAAWISEHYGAPLMLMGLLFGLALNFANSDVKLHPGLGFASRTLLRWGIVLLGFKVTLADIASLGVSTFIAIAIIVTLVIGTGIVAARSLRLGTSFGVLAGGAVAICGASAALAFAALLGEKRVSQAQLTLTLVAIAAASAVAMSLYPMLTSLLGLDPVHAGFVMGASIHDVAQALGAGYSISAPSGETATIVKLTRVALLIPALGVTSIFLGRQPDNAAIGRNFPWFVLGFLGAALLNSLVPIPAPLPLLADKAAGAMLLLAVVATGIRSPMHLLLQQGWRSSLPVVIASLISLGLALTFASLG
jgi:uncharacterized integral membrane protein (TIGR00698 family)